MVSISPKILRIKNNSQGILQSICHYGEKEEIIMNKMALAAIGIGAAFLMRNKNARGNLMKQFEGLTTAFSPKSGSQSGS